MDLEQAVSRFCGSDFSPLEISALLKNLLTSYFSSPDNIIHDALKTRIYSDNSSQIIIEAAAAYKPEEAGFRPAIIITSGNWEARPLGIGSGFTLGSNPPRYGFNIVGQHIVNCIAKLPAETELLAAEVFLFLMSMRPIILRQFPIATFDSIHKTTLEPFNEGRTHYIERIMINYVVNYQYTIDITESTTTSSP
ncbi:MAG: hypothetical protein KatS3mg087_0089 [Patescibacteria group bacterium]|nr:MAG: hypothetical protein KatS3mg087_0089 [Patescibacteria group bacterium]